MNESKETSSQEVKTGKEIIIDYLTGSHEFLCNDKLEYVLFPLLLFLFPFSFLKFFLFFKFELLLKEFF